MQKSCQILKGGVSPVKWILRKHIHINISKPTEKSKNFIWRNRMNYDEPSANPLPKLYHEKRDDSEKVRFNIPRERRDDFNDKGAEIINEQAE